MSLLKVDSIKKIYADASSTFVALKNLSFEINEGEFVSIMGPSGSGKTTLLNCVSTFDKVSAGHIYLNNIEITELKREKLSAFRRETLGFIFQEYNLLDSLTVFENIALPLAINGIGKQEIEKRVASTAGLLGLRGVLDKYPQNISGGEKQRCSTARALVCEPKLLLADEPTGALDYGNSKKFLSLLEQINEKQKSTILMVTHDPLSASFGKRTLFLKDGKLYNELFRGDMSQKEYYNEIIKVVSVIGDDFDD